MIKKRIAVAMSGGVDSSVAAYLLKEQGYEIAGFFMRNGIFNEEAEKDAKMVCDFLDIEFYAIDLKADFDREVVQYFIDEYKSGRTPNPCAICNRFVKFGEFIEKIDKVWKHDYFATGHYAKIREDMGENYLYISSSDKKDQSYFLSTVKRKYLNKTIFSLADQKKEEVREFAKHVGIPVAEKNDSQEICFVPSDNYREFLNEKGVSLPSGHFKRENGEILGDHEGIHTVTIGQRKGLKFSAEQKLYVKEIDIDNNTVIVAPHENLFSGKLKARIVNYSIKESDIAQYLDEIVQCRIRTGSPLTQCKFSIDGDILSVEFSEKQFAVTPGQLCVLYHNEKVLLSSVIL